MDFPSFGRRTSFERQEIMQAVDQLLGSTGFDLGALASRFGLSPEEAKSAMGSLMPAVLGGFQKKAEAGDLTPVTSTAAQIDQPDTASGNQILGHIFGNKDVSRQVADHAAAQTGGISSNVMRAMLPVVAAMVAKHFSSNGNAGGGGIGGMLGSLMGGAGGSAGLGGLGAMLGGSGGNPLDAILGSHR